MLKKAGAFILSVVVLAAASLPANADLLNTSMTQRDVDVIKAFLDRLPNNYYVLTRAPINQLIDMICKYRKKGSSSIMIAVTITEVLKKDAEATADERSDYVTGLFVFGIAAYCPEMKDW